MKALHQGFTLIELLVVVAIVAILAGLAVPSFNTMLAKRSVQSAALALVSDIRFARSEALRRSATVSICSLEDNSTTACSGATAKWKNGWLVFVDGTNRGTVDVGEEIVRVQQQLPNIASIASTNPGSDRPRFTFEATGFAKAANQTLVFTPLSGASSTTTRLVCISITGRPSLRDAGVTAC